MALADTLNKPFDPLAASSAITGGGTAQARGAAARKGYPDILQAESRAREDVLREEQTAKKAAIAEEERLAKEFAGRERALSEEYRAGLQPAPEAQITKFDSAAAGELAVQTALLGALTGFVNAEASLGAIEGFTRGHKQGREDLYKQEVANYERNYKKWKDNNTLAKQILDDSLKLLSTDKTAAMVSLKRLEPLLQDGVILAKVKQGDVVGAKNLFDKAIDTENKIDSSVETAVGKPPKVSDKQRMAMVQNQELLRRLENLKNTAKKEYFQLAPLDTLAKLRLSAQEVGLGDLAGIFGLDVDNSAVLWWKDYFDLISEERKERFGATLTGNEKKSFRETIVEPSSTYDIGLGVLQRKIDLAKQSNQNVLQAFGREQAQPEAAAQGAGQGGNQALRQQAQAAISSGKDPAAVRALYKQLTGEDL
jgi:hypothetical protein